MGVDAVMKIKPLVMPTEREIRRLSYELTERVGAESFFLFPKRNEHAIKIDDEDSTMLDLNLSMRYYGVGYERGHFPTILMMATWADMRLPGCTVYYGGDSSWKCPEFTINDRLELLKHWVNNGCEPYHRAFNSRSDSGWSEFCDFCIEPMNRSGWGGAGPSEFGVFTCLGCGAQRISRDGGITYEKHENKDRITKKLEPTQKQLSS